ncbi:MAG: hypothetical protein PHE09_07175, partial [Oscillospiraceae bacterium]|nr:hypothetical protein [Oscillospiraceae bacterium]
MYQPNAISSEAPKITLIQARKPETAKLRVAAYARVSSNSEDQQNSYIAQVDYYTRHIASQEGWELADIYAEMKISKMIQFENTNPPRKRRNKGFRHIRCCRESLFFVPWNDC